MELKEYLQMYEKVNDKPPSDDIKEFFAQSVEIPLIYKDGQITISKGEGNGSQDNR